MGTVNVAFGRKLNKGANDGPQALLLLSSENMSTSTTSSQSAAAPDGLPAANDIVVRVFPIDEPVYVRTGADPTAIVGDLYIATGQEMYLNLAPGHKVAVKEVA